MFTFFAYLGLGLLILKGVAPFFSSIRPKENRIEVDQALGFSEDSKNPSL